MPRPRGLSLDPSKVTKARGSTKIMKLAQNSGIGAGRLGKILGGQPTSEEYAIKIADALKVQLKDILPDPPKVPRHVIVFICSAQEDEETAQRWADKLNKSGFEIWNYHSEKRTRLRTIAFAEARKQLHRSDFILVIRSKNSYTKDGTLRDLGLAHQIAKKVNYFRPLFISVDCPDCEDVANEHFVTRDFDTGNEDDDTLILPPGVPSSSPDALAEETVVLKMTPRLLISRIDFLTAYQMRNTGWYELYQDLFPKIEQDNRSDIENWVLRSDIGEERPIDILGESYKLDLRFCILTINNLAIGLAFLTYDYKASLMFGNYIAIHESWRGAGLAKYFSEAIEQRLAKERLFQNSRGIVFEVEPFRISRVKEIIAYLEGLGNDKKFRRRADRDEIRKFIRAWMYQNPGGLGGDRGSDKKGYRFFLDAGTNEPIGCTSPSLDDNSPPGRWPRQEADYWLMWQSRNLSTPIDEKTLWVECVECLYLEILAKSLVDPERRASDERGLQYWQYAKAVVARTLERQRQTPILIGRYRTRELNELYERWSDLDIPIPI